MDTAFLIRLGIAIVLLAITFVLIARRQRTVRQAALGRPTLRRRVSSLPRGYRRQEQRLAPLGFATVGDYDLCDQTGARIHRMFVSCNASTSTLYLRGMHVSGYFTRLAGTESTPPTIVVQSGVLDVDWTPPDFVVQTIRGVKHGSDSAMIALHDEAIALLGQEGWDERVRITDPPEFALSVLVSLAAARSNGTKRSGVDVGRAVHRTYATGRAQIGCSLRSIDPADLDHDALDQQRDFEP